jgi:hypothetical protein
MKYIYKTETIIEFGATEEGKKFLRREGLAMIQRIQQSKLTEEMLNYYAKNGWEFMSVSNQEPICYETPTKIIYNFSKEGSPNLPIYIFRKEYDDEEYLELNKTQMIEIMKEFPDQIDGRNYKKVTLKDIDVMQFSDSSYGLIDKNICYVYEDKSSLEKSINNLKDYGKLSDIGLVEKIKVEK